MCPPHVDQTCRTAQRWHILAPRLRQRHELSPSRELQGYIYHRSGVTAEEFLFGEGERKPWNAWAKLAKPVSKEFWPPVLSQGKMDGSSGGGGGSGSRVPTRPTACSPTSTTDDGADTTKKHMVTSASSPRSKSGSSGSSSLECMPAELLTMVFDDGGLEPADVVSLGLCSRNLWRHMLRRVERAYRESAAPWAGAEIACTGTYLTDLPASFEKDNLAVDSVADIDAAAPARMVLARRFNWAAWGQFEHQPPEAADVDKGGRQHEEEKEEEGGSRESQSQSQEDDAWRSALRVHRHSCNNTAHIPDACWPGLERDVVRCGRDNLFPGFVVADDVSLSPQPPQRQGFFWALRNLTTREFVRVCRSSEEGKGEEVVVIDDDDDDDDDADKNADADVDAQSESWSQLRLDDVLIMRIWWTSGIFAKFGGGEEEEEAAEQRGKWAGHRFDIVMLPREEEGSSLEEDSSAEADDGVGGCCGGWKDVTAEVVSEARGLRRLIQSGPPFDAVDYLTMFRGWGTGAGADTQGSQVL